MELSQQELELSTIKDKKELEATTEKLPDLKRKIDDQKGTWAKGFNFIPMKFFNFPKFCKWFKVMVRLELLINLIGIGLVIFAYVQVDSKLVEAPLDPDQWLGPPWFTSCLSWRIADAMASWCLLDLEQHHSGIFWFLGIAICKFFGLGFLLEAYFVPGFSDGVWQMVAWRTSFLWGAIWSFRGGTPRHLHCSLHNKEIDYSFGF